MDKIKSKILPQLSHRSRQLNVEQQIDTKLARLDCDSVVREYYQLYREWNRITYQETFSDLWNYRALTTQNLQEIDTHQQRLQTVLVGTDSPCNTLKSFVEQFRNKIS
uniref:Uncharacterized protein n=1 Tax=Marseillevirus LCMAC201 TaxID=2506605 RepID=A0A481YVS3_9VIRU|nr:MAG: hypothetical protein LCMAC201_02000 [Marseillevirus LCMAC201]